MEDKHTHDDEVTEVVAEDIADTDMDIEAGEATLKDQIKQLKIKLKESEKGRAETLEELQRAKADFLNSKRRLTEQCERDKERAQDDILRDLLVIADTFDTAMTDETWQSIDENWRKGVEGIHTKLLSILSTQNIEPIAPEGEVFNPEEHEAVSNQAVEDEKQVDTVIAVLQKGYKRNGTIIRPAKVVVGTK